MNNEEKMFQKSQINWYPGHMKKTKDELIKIMPFVDLVLEIIDARAPLSSKIKDINNIIKDKSKILIMSKSDLCDLKETNKWKVYYESLGYYVVLTNLNDNNDYKKIIDLINEVIIDINLKRKNKGLKEKEIKAVVIGIPNVGKSTLINKLAGKKVSVVGNKPGVTKALTWLKTKEKMVILDTPGILWPKFDNDTIAFNLASTSAINENILPLGDVAYYILEFLDKYYNEILKERFKIDKLNDGSFDIIGKNIGAIKNNEVDYHRVYMYILNEVKNEKIKGITFDRKEV